MSDDGGGGGGGDSGGGGCDSGGYDAGGCDSSANDYSGIGSTVSAFESAAEAVHQVESTHHAISHASETTAADHILSQDSNYTSNNDNYQQGLYTNTDVYNPLYNNDYRSYNVSNSSPWRGTGYARQCSGCKSGECYAKIFGVAVAVIIIVLLLIWGKPWNH